MGRMRRTGIYLQFHTGFADFIACIGAVAVAVADGLVVRGGVIGVSCVVVVVVGEQSTQPLP